jgi:hypothetical protein
MPLCQEYALVDALIERNNLTGHDIEKKILDWEDASTLYAYIVVLGGMIRDYAIYLSLGLSDSFPLVFSLLRYILTALVQD